MKRRMEFVSDGEDRDSLLLMVEFVSDERIYRVSLLGVNYNIR